MQRRISVRAGFEPTGVRMPRLPTRSIGCLNGEGSALHLKLTATCSVAISLGALAVVKDARAADPYDYSSDIRAEALTGLYLGGSYGRADNEYDTSIFDNQLKELAASGHQTLTFHSSTLQRRTNAWTAELGYMVWSKVGIEASYLHLGELTYRAYGTVKPPGQPLTATTSVLSRGPALALVIRMPLLESFDVNARIGDYFARTTLTTGYAFEGSYNPESVSSNGSSLMLGLGAAYTFLGHWSVRVDYRRIVQAGGGSDVAKYNADLATVGASFTF